MANLAHDEPAQNDPGRAQTPSSESFPDERPPIALRLLIEHLWLLVVPLFLGLFLLIIHLTNQEDLSFLPMPRALQAGAAAGILYGLWRILQRVAQKQIDWSRYFVLLTREGSAALRDGKRRMRSYGHRLKSEPKAAVEAALASLHASLQGSSSQKLSAALDATDQALSEHLPQGKKGLLRENGEAIGGAIIIALLLRAFVVEAFKIPSGSMLTTLEVGDHIFVNKFLYGVRVPWTNIKFFTHLREPKRGEVIVFVFPEDHEKDFIKRIVAVPGDTVEVCGGQVKINGQPLWREPESGTCEYDDFDEERPTDGWRKVPCSAYRERNGENTYRTVFRQGSGGAMDLCSQPVTIRPDSVFVMGDNRDSSHDSRAWGQVSYDLIKGKAWFIWWSAGQKTSVRLNRLTKRIH